MVELSNVEKLAIAQAFQKAVGDMTKTGDPTNLRGVVDAEMKERYATDPMAGLRYDVKLMGEKVGTYTMTVAKGKPRQSRIDFEVEDMSALLEWAERNGYVTVDIDWDGIRSGFERDGEVPEGCRLVEIITPEVVGGEISRTTLKIKPELVARVLGPSLEPIACKLLEGRDDG